MTLANSFHNKNIEDIEVKEKNEVDTKKLLFSNSVLKASLELIKKTPEKYASLISTLSSSKEFLENEKLWHNIQFANIYWNQFAFLMGDDALEKSTYELYANSNFKPFTTAIGLLLKLESFYKRMPQMAARVNQYNQYSFKIVHRKLNATTGELTQEYLSNANDKLNHRLCLCARGSIRGVNNVFGYKLLNLEESECVRLGNHRCVYRFTWQNRIKIAPYFINLSLSLIVTLLLSQFYFKDNHTLNIITFFGLFTTLTQFYQIKKMRRQIEESTIYQDSSFSEYRMLLEKCDALNKTLLENQKELEKMLKLSVIGELSYGILHDMAAPILSINHNSLKVKNSFVQNNEPNPQLLKSVESITKAGNKLVFFQKSLRKIISGSSLKNSVNLNINDCVIEVIELMKHLQNQNSIEVEFQIDPNIDPIQTYEGYLERVLINFITNAYKSLTHSLIKKVEIHVKNEIDNIHIFITDTGPGIPTEILSNLQKDFGANQEDQIDGIKSSGFGIYSTSKLIKEMQGELSIQSELKQGTKIKIILPKFLKNSAL